MELKDSGARREFGTGAVRDIQDDKGRCDLLPLVEVGMVTEDDILSYIGHFMETGTIGYIVEAIRRFSRDNYPNGYGDSLLNLAKHFADGAKKYTDRNWEKGIPCHCFVDSGVRHYIKFMAGWDDEPHDRAFLWNMYCLLWTLRHHPDLNDLPQYSDYREESNEQ